MEETRPEAEVTTYPGTADVLPEPESRTDSETLTDVAERDAAAANWAEASSLILEAVGEGIYGLDLHGLTTFINPAAEAMLGWRAEEMLGRLQHTLAHHSYADGSSYTWRDCPIYMALRDGRVHRSDNEVFWRKDGTSFPVAYTSTPILQDGQPVGAVVLFQDISKRKRREAWEKSKNTIFVAITSHRELDFTFGLLAAAFRALHPSHGIALFVKTSAGLDLIASAGMPELLERNLPGSFPSISQRAAEDGKTILLSRGKGEANVEFRDSQFQACLAVPLFSGSGTGVGVATFFAQEKSFPGRLMETVQGVCDLARLAIEHKQLHAQLIRQSKYDHLTGLPNRSLLEDRLEQAIARAKRHGTRVGVGYLDLDRFKEVNDTLGHSIGDALLQHVANVLKRSLREIDTVARHGGDEFILVLPDLSGMGEAREVCERLLAVVRVPVELGSTRTRPSASIGLCLFPEGGGGAGALLRNADTALYAAKRRGRGCVHCYQVLPEQEAENETAR